MALQQPFVIIDPLGQLVTGGQLAANEDGRSAEWIVPSERERAPNPPYGYVVSFIRFHERGFTTLTSRFMRAHCYHYGVELHNFAPNAISQAAMFVDVCEGFLGITHYRRRSRGPAARRAPAACRSPCGPSARMSTSPA
jgi:hypothetical protein